MTFRSASLAALAAATVALVPAAAPAEAAPRTYEASLPGGGELSFKLGLLSKRIVRISGEATLTCDDGTTVEDRWILIVLGPKADKRFTYRGDGLVLSGSMTSARRAKGTLDRTVGSCSATGLKWTAKRKAS